MISTLSELDPARYVDYIWPSKQEIPSSRRIEVFGKVYDLPSEAAQRFDKILIEQSKMVKERESNQNTIAFSFAFQMDSILKNYFKEFEVN